MSSGRSLSRLGVASMAVLAGGCGSQLPQTAQGGQEDGGSTGELVAVAQRVRQATGYTVFCLPVDAFGQITCRVSGAAEDTPAVRVSRDQFGRFTGIYLVGTSRVGLRGFVGVALTGARLQPGARLLLSLRCLGAPTCGAQLRLSHGGAPAGAGRRAIRGRAHLRVALRGPARRQALNGQAVTLRVRIVSVSGSGARRSQSRLVVVRPATQRHRR